MAMAHQFFCGLRQTARQTALVSSPLLQSLSRQTCRAQPTCRAAPLSSFFSTQKNKSPQRKASYIMHHLRNEQIQAPLPYPEFRPGDALEVKMLPHKGADKPVVMRGVVISKVNRGIDTSFIIKDVFLGEVIERRISLYAPLIQDIKVLQRRFIHRGKKRVRRSKLYYLRDKDPLICKVS